MRDGGVRRIAGAQEVLRALVIAFLAGHAAPDESGDLFLARAEQAPCGLLTGIGQMPYSAAA